MRSIILHFKRFDWILIASLTLLVAFGLVAIYSTSLSGGDFLNLEKQLIFFGVGMVLMAIFSFFDWRNLKNDSYLVLFLYSLCVIALVLVLFFAPEVRGTKSWFKIGPISIDPIEFTKIALIILLAKYFSKRHVEVYRIRHILFSGFYALFPAALVFVQPNFGSAMILVAIWFGMLILSGVKVRHFLLIIFTFAVVFLLAWHTVLKDYQKARIISFIMPQTVDQLAVGWNQAQSKIAIGSGGILGQGIGKGSQTQYGFLPEAHTDFIFATIAEETGLTGVVILFLLFGIVIWRIIKIASRAESNFPRLFALGLATLLVFQFFINIGMNMGILPIIGTPLPFISYGGSGLIAIFLAIGILQNIKVTE